MVGGCSLDPAVGLGPGGKGAGDGREYDRKVSGRRVTAWRHGNQMNASRASWDGMECQHGLMDTSMGGPVPYANGQGPRNEGQ